MQDINIFICLGGGYRRKVVTCSLLQKYYKQVDHVTCSFPDVRFSSSDRSQKMWLVFYTDGRRNEKPFCF